MSLGKNIRDMRRKIGMSQSQLAGDYISRNMLSMIENDRADPSVKTVQYLADRLSVPVSFLFDKCTDIFEARCQFLLPKIRSLFSERKYTACLSECSKLGGSQNDELEYIITVCYYHIGIEACSRFSLSEAIDAFQSALQHANHTVLDTSFHEEICQSSIAWIQKMMATETIYYPIPILSHPDSISRFYAWILPHIQILPEKFTLQCMESDLPFPFAARQHILAVIMMQNGEFEKALEALLLAQREARTDLERCFILTDLETVYTKLQNYELAFRVSDERQNYIRRVKKEMQAIKKASLGEKNDNNADRFILFSARFILFDLDLTANFISHMCIPRNIQ